MPKMKSHSGAKKRYRVTANGKVKHGSPGKSHILTKKPRKRKADLREGSYLESEKQARAIKSLLQK
ncbi:MAG: 50S ribosomal protein L35 [Firmicutes bacterium]|nr:50S ribosomal protein L35 [Bacillota bacterium]